MIAAPRHWETAEAASCGVDVEVAGDDKREGARAGVGADGAKDDEVLVAEVTARDEVERVENDGSGGTIIDIYGDGASRHGYANAGRSCGAFPHEDADACAGAGARSWERTGYVGAPLVSVGPSAEVGCAYAENVELLRGDDCGGGVAEEGLEAGSSGAVVGDDLEVRIGAGRGPCPCP